MHRWYVGSCEQIRVTFRDDDGAPVDVSAVTVEVLNRITGATVLEATNIVENHPETGIYYHKWTPVKPGTYVAVFRGVVQGDPQIIPIAFRVHAPIEAPVSLH